MTDGHQASISFLISPTETLQHKLSQLKAVSVIQGLRGVKAVHTKIVPCVLLFPYSESTFHDLAQHGICIAIDPPGDIYPKIPIPRRG